MVVAHGANGWLDEIIELGIPLVVLVFLYLWSNRKAKSGPDKAKHGPDK